MAIDRRFRSEQVHTYTVSWGGPMSIGEAPGMGLSGRSNPYLIPPGEAGGDGGTGVERGVAGVGVGVGGIGGGFTKTELLGTTEFCSVEDWPGVVVVWLAAG